ncbi:nuclear transport factor 2 family protein [Streptomyces iconiensis]|uniref:Nuclear transport factor 2 family protein n=1 Tax=Streptomyces iconiensis TaxID=1384038 RepID=A0ABT7A099_9ACTN|nr:nuclear transport factor 2 family protein [Streptomyces iconiensis]MDJ1134749.1 nuclear transport factor 2 family protein [Streptomyces iconiensis]
MTATTLEERILRLEDIEAIRDLTARYADAINKGWNGKTVDADAIPDIFAADARWEGFDGEVTHGADAIAAVLPKATSVVQLSMHTFLNPVITVDGDTATGDWLMWVGSVMADNPRSVYMSADMTYTRTDKGWRIQSVLIGFGTMVRGSDGGTA